MPQGTNPHALHDTAKGLYEDKTGDWVFETPEWDKWINCRERALWIHGIPGAGKTILASHVIEKTLSVCETKGKQARCIYYYCHHSHNQDETTPFLRWLISQLLQGLDKFPDVALQAPKGLMLPDFTQLLAILAEVLPSFDRVYVGIDALDESQPRVRLLALLERFIIEPRFAKIQLFATSREYEDIRRKMSSISQPLSMSNPFVEADIRLYVAAKIAENPRFRCWPGGLRSEVEDALSTGAKGMFRWAVCQLDILRRLHQQSKIREAIRSLPETLDETYERIFSYISKEEQGVVRYALHLACFHDVLWKGEAPLPAQVLLDFYAVRENAENRPSLDDSLLDLDTLKDICGCLISFSSAWKGETANVAHYTVREYLESSRASGLVTPSMKIGHEDRCAILASIFEYAIAWVEDGGNHHGDDDYQFLISPDSSLGMYCLASAVESFVKCEALVQPSLAFELLNPCGAHYETLQGMLKRREKSDPDWFEHGSCWSISWADGCKSSKASILISLLAMDCFALAKVWVNGLDMKGLMQEELNGEIMLPPYWPEFGQSGLEHEPVEVEGNLVSLLCQLRILNKGTLGFLQQEASTLIDYGNLLPGYMLDHNYCMDSDSHYNYCVLEQLLHHGADPNPKGFPVMPLQIAAYKRDLLGLTSLLEQGADPNNTGNPQGNAPFVLLPAELSGVALVDILCQLPPADRITRSEKESGDNVVPKIESLLGAHGLSLPEGWWELATGTTS